MGNKDRVAVCVHGLGAYLPERVLSNDEISTFVDTNDEWIVQRTGIKSRRIAADDQFCSDLAYEAAQVSLRTSGVAPSELDYLVVATSTPDYTFPATATLVQHRLGASGAAFDMQAVCSGFVYGLHTVRLMMQAQGRGNALLIGAETFSRIIDWTDRSTCILFADGAGSIVISARSVSAEDPSPRGEILSSIIRSDGSHSKKLFVDGGVSRTQSTGHLRMQGREVFKFAVTQMPSIIAEALEAAQVTVDDIDHFVPHQANKRLIDAIATKVGLTSEKIVYTLEEHGNVSSASIPLALYEAEQAGRFKAGDLILLQSLGGGFTWGAAVIRW